MSLSSEMVDSQVRELTSDEVDFVTGGAILETLLIAAGTAAISKLVDEVDWGDAWDWFTGLF